MVYLNKYKQISDEAEKSLYSLVRDLINKNTTYWTKLLQYNW